MKNSSLYPGPLIKLKSGIFNKNFSPNYQICTHACTRSRSKVLWTWTGDRPQAEHGTHLFYEDSELSPSLRTKTQRLKSEFLKFKRLGL
jgi:hypothetical protein